MININEQKAEYLRKYGKQPRIFRAPGRVNIIGEHTDYNGGWVLPFAIDFNVYITGSVRDDRKIRVSSRNFEGDYEIDLNKPDSKIEKNWAKYVQGVVFTLEKSGYRLKGADLLIGSDIPIGAGLSSSAALEIAVGFALSSLSEIAVEKWTLVKIGQTAEHEYAGVKTGIMDQFSSAFGIENHALFLDCASLAWSPVPLSKATFVVCNTQTKHDLVESEYDQRRADCEAAATILGGESLRDISLKDFKSRSGELPERLRKRARHVLTENERVLGAVKALQDNRLGELGKLMNESHESLRTDFQVTTYELDLMVEIAKRQTGLLGARMTGGGFGGCTINLFENDIPTDFIENVSTEYQRITGIQPEIYVCDSTRGVSELQEKLNESF